MSIVVEIPETESRDQKIKYSKHLRFSLSGKYFFCIQGSFNAIQIKRRNNLYNSHEMMLNISKCLIYKKDVISRYFNAKIHVVSS